MPAPVKWKPDFELVNLENPEGEPWLSASPDGRFSLIFYETLAGPPVHTDLEERIYTAAGDEQSAIGTTFSSTTSEHQAASAYLPDGRRVYVWTEEPVAGGGNLEDVYAEVRFGNNIVDVARFLVSGGAGQQHDPVVAANSAGFVVALADTSVAGGQLILKFYNIAGTLINTVVAPNAPQTVATGSAGLFRDVEITALDNGNYVIVWDSEFNADVFARVYSSGGVAQSGVINVQTGAPTAAFPDVTALADGRFAVTYSEYVAGLVRGSIFNPNGTADVASFAIGSGAANEPDNQVQTAALHDGRFVTVWKSTAGDIIGQVMFADGTADGPAFTVNTVTAGDQSRPTIATLADGRFAVSWESGAGAAPETIITTIFDPREEGVNLVGTTASDHYIGTLFADTIFAGAGNDLIEGAAGDDQLYGGTGIDTMRGGLGNDTYIINSANDNIVELAGEGTADRASASVSFILAAGDNIEFLDTTNAAGLGLINLTGNEIAQTIAGNAGANFLNGGIDALSDNLVGRLGNDTYIINSANDNIVENAGEGTADRASASLSFILAAGDNIEFLDTTNAAGLGAINLTGNEIAQTIAGNAGANILNGGVDALSDILVGRAGNDTYIINTATDNIVENAGEGTADRASASLSFILAAGDNIEFLDTTNAAGLGAINLIGNEIAQTIAGNAGANILNGGIDALSDILVGRAGNDTYIINSATDNIVENAGEGLSDRASASVSFVLAAGDNIEFLDTTNAAGLGLINLTGNEIAQTITGNAGANILNGMFGNDTLTGGLGADSFLFNTTPNSVTNRDVITDFNVAADSIQLENTGIFTALGAVLGVLDAAMFKNLTTGGAVDATDRILYDDVTGAVSYDSDGSGATAAIQFATLTGAPTVTNADFFVI